MACQQYYWEVVEGNAIREDTAIAPIKVSGYHNFTRSRWLIFTVMRIL